ncbi:MAG: nucleotidyltransferase family protein [Gemmatimonadales bacterium]|jgi:hypothetical protein
MAIPRQALSRWHALDLDEAVALRAWALKALSAEHGNAGGLDPPPIAAATTWESFLEVEGCAIALSRLRTAVPRAVATDAGTAIEAWATIALKRVLAARAQLRDLGELAGRLGRQVIALKGAVSVARGHDLELDDIDLLIRPEEADGFAHALDASGYHATGGASPRHLGTRVLPGGLGVELHVTLHRYGRAASEELWSSTTPLDGSPGLQRLDALEHAWHVLTHIAIDHPDRRGRIRDLLLITDACADCSSYQIRALRRRISEHPYRDELERLQRMARSLAEGPPVVDEYQRLAAVGYSLRSVLDRLRLPDWIVTKTWRWAFAFLGSRADRREVLAETTERCLAPSRYRIIYWVEQRAPRLGQAWRVFLRLARLPVVIVIAIVLTGLARYQLRRSGL